MVKAFQKVGSAFSRAGNKIKKNVCLCAAKLSAASRFWFFVNTEQCPKCKLAIEKTEGCNHITCKCGHQFCWQCLRDWSNHGQCTQTREQRLGAELEENKKTLEDLNNQVEEEEVAEEVVVVEDDDDGNGTSSSTSPDSGISSAATENNNNSGNGNGAADAGADDEDDDRDGIISIFVRDAYRVKTYTLEMRATDTIMTLKNIVHAKTFLKPEEQRFIYGSKPIDREDLTLADYGITGNATLHMAMRLRGGFV